MGSTALDHRTDRDPGRDPGRGLCAAGNSYLDDAAAADKVSGVISYRRLLVATRLLAALVERLPDKNIGVLLPASVGADITFFGLHLAGKLPVMLNWTTGPANLAHALQTLAVRHVVTSRKLLDRLGIQMPGVERIFLRTCAGGWAKRRPCGPWRPPTCCPAVSSNTCPGGTPTTRPWCCSPRARRKRPKAVPLTHRNLISNVRVSLEAFPNSRADRLLGCLPPFHSFGLLGSVMAPLLTGIRVVHTPDPSNAPELVRTTARYRATLLGPHAHVPGLHDGHCHGRRFPQRADSGHRRGEMFRRTLRPHRTACPPGHDPGGLRHYECSPVVAANRVGRTKAGTVHTHDRRGNLRGGSPGRTAVLPPTPPACCWCMAYRSSPATWATTGTDPFVEVAGKRWYVTGNLVLVDDEGFLHFQGRLKRFLKAGGGRDDFAARPEKTADRAFPPTDNGPQVAVEGMRPRRAGTSYFSPRRDHAGRGQQHPFPSRLPRHHAIGRGHPLGKHPPVGHRQDRLQGLCGKRSWSLGR